MDRAQHCVRDEAFKAMQPRYFYVWLKNLYNSVVEFGIGKERFDKCAYAKSKENEVILWLVDSDECNLNDFWTRQSDMNKCRIDAAKASLDSFDRLPSASNAQ